MRNRNPDTPLGSVLLPVYWDVGRGQRGLVFPDCLRRLGVVYGE